MKATAQLALFEQPAPTPRRPRPVPPPIRPAVAAPPKPKREPFVSGMKRERVSIVLEARSPRSKIHTIRAVLKRVLRDDDPDGWACTECRSLP